MVIALCPQEVTISFPSALRTTTRLLGGAAGLLALYLAAHAVATVVGWRVFVQTEPLGSDATRQLLPQPSSLAQPKSTAIERWSPSPAPTRLGSHNPFCPSCVAAPPTVATPAVPPPPGVERLTPDEHETELPLTLIATMEAVPPARSLATLSYEGRAGLYAEGDTLLEGVELLAVDNGVVHLKVGPGLEFLRMPSDGAAKPKQSKPKKPKPKKPKPKSAFELDGARDAISCKGNSCTIERRFVTGLLANPAQLMRQGRAMPYSRDGLRGFRLSRVRRGTIPQLLGLRSGDVLTSINGEALTTVDAAMRMYARLRNASHLTVELVRSRRGKRQPVRLDIDIV